MDGGWKDHTLGNSHLITDPVRTLPLISPNDPLEATAMLEKPDFLAVAWRDFLDFAIRDKDLRATFTRDTGRTIGEGDDMMAFVIWATRTQWGWNESPASFRADAEKWERDNGPVGRGS